VLHGQPGQEQRAQQQQHAGHRNAGPVPAVVAAGVPEQPHPDAQVTGGQQREQYRPTLPQLARTVEALSTPGQSVDGGVATCAVARQRADLAPFGSSRHTR